MSVVTMTIVTVVTMIVQHNEVDRVGLKEIPKSQEVFQKWPKFTDKGGAWQSIAVHSGGLGQIYFGLMMIFMTRESGQEWLGSGQGQVDHGGSQWLIMELTQNLNGHSKFEIYTKRKGELEWDG